MIRNNRFKTTELGLLPEEWEVVKLGDVFDLKQGKQLSARESTEGKIKKPFLRTSNVFWGNVNIEKIDEMFFTLNDYEKLRLKYGDVLVCEGGDVGRTALYRDELEECAYQNHLHRLRPKKKNANPEFFVDWMIFAITIKKMYIHAANRTTIPNLSGSRLKNFQIPLPPLPEQHKIAAVLSTVQEAKEKTGAVIAAVKSLKKSLMRHLFTYGPVPVGAVESMPLTETEIGLVPEGWEVKKLVEVAEKNSDIVGGPFGSNLKVSDYTDLGVPIIRLQNIERNEFINKDIKFISEKKAEELKYHSFTGGDIVLAKLGDPIGKTCLVPSNLNYGIVIADVVRIRTRKELTDKDYIVYALNSSFCEEHFRKEKTGTTRPRVNVSNVRNVKIPLPPLPTQQKIASILSTVDKKIEAEENKKAALGELFKSLLHNLMTAKIRVNHLETTQ